MENKENENVVEAPPIVEEASTTSVDPTTNTNDVSFGASEVSLDNNPFMEQTVPTSSEVTNLPEQNLDNIFNAQPSDLIIPTPVLENPNDVVMSENNSLEQDIINVSPNDVFGNEAQYDAITEMVSESVANEENIATPLDVTVTEHPLEESDLAQLAENPDVTVVMPVEEGIVENEIPQVDGTLEDNSTVSDTGLEFGEIKDLPVAEEFIPPEIVQNQVEESNEEEIKVEDSSPVIELTNEQMIESDGSNLAPVADNGEMSLNGLEEQPVVSDSSQEVIENTELPLENNEGVIQEEAITPIEEVSINEIANQEEMTSPVIEDVQENVLPDVTDSNAESEPVVSADIVSLDESYDNAESDVEVNNDLESEDDSSSELAIEENSESSSNTDNSDDNLSILDRTNEMILNFTNPEEAENEGTIAAEDYYSNDVNEENSGDEENSDIGVSDNNEIAQEEQEIKPIIEDEETVILPTIDEEIVANQDGDEITQEDVKPLIEEEKDDIYISSPEKTDDSETNIENEEADEDGASEESEDKLPVIDLDISSQEDDVYQSEESNLSGVVPVGEESQVIELSSDYVSDEEVPEEESQEETQEATAVSEEEEVRDIAPIDFQPFLNMNNLDAMADIDNNVSETEEVGVYISDPTPTKFCNNCGIMLTDDSSICPSCGEPID